MNRLLFLLLTLMVTGIAMPGPALLAQGFARKYPGNGGFSPWCQLKTLPDGYSLEVNDYAFGGTRFRLIETDAQAFPTADTTLDFGGNITDVRYGWLAGGHFLEVAHTPQMDSLKIALLTRTGNLLWRESFDVPDFAASNYSIVAESADGNIYVGGTLYELPPPTDQTELFLLKLSATGDLLWKQTWPSLSGQTYFEEDTWVRTPDDGIAFIAHRTTPEPDAAVQVMRFGGDGTLLWEKKVGNLWSVSTGGMGINAAGDIGVVKHHGFYGEGHFVSLNANGDTLAYQLLNGYFGPHTIDLNPLRVFPYPESHGWLIGGYVRFANPDIQRFFLMCVDNTGALRWTRLLNPFGQDLPNLGDAVMLDHGNCVIGGTLYNNGPGPFMETWLPFLMKVDSLGRVFSHSIEGWVRLDQNLDCEATAGELPFPNAVVTLAAGNTDSPVFLTTDTSGYYLFTDVDTGQYIIRAIPPNSYWEPCDTATAFYLPDSAAQTVRINEPIQALTECPYMTVDVSTPILRRCFQSYYVLQYCNYGSTTADSASIQFVLDPLIRLDTASMAYTQNGDAVFFNLGAVAPFDCGSVTVFVTVDCDSTFLNQTLCVSASIFPDTFCNPPATWSGALLEGSGQCVGDSVRFQLRNIGTAPNSTGLNSYVVDEHVIMFEDMIPVLNPGEIHEIFVASDGSTLRLIADQEPNAPGQEMPSVGVEGCGAGNPHSWGFMLQFPNHDGNPFTDTDCHEVVGSFDPNDKQAFPLGVGNEHFIEPNQALDYQIRFQNTGTDTAFTVVVKDTLSPWLDPASVRPGAASHPYTWALSGAGVLTFTFEHILLPDSNVNEAASHGFIRFNVSQRKDLPMETRIENRAGIYFDFNLPVMTNTVFHTISHRFLESAAREPVKGERRLTIWPNPAGQQAIIGMDLPFRSGQHLVLRNVLGQIILDVPAREVLQRTTMPAGLYLVELHGSQGVVATGKLIWK